MAIVFQNNNMNLYDLLLKPYEGYETYQILLEGTATLFGLLSVFFSIKKNIWVYPTGIISTALYVYILFIFGLLGDMMINVYYTIMSVYGWMLWAKNTEDQIHINAEYASRKDWIFSGILFVFSLALVTVIYYYKPFIDNGFNFQGTKLGIHHLDWANWLDVATTSIFLVGMWMMAKRKIENWIFWIIGDLVCIPMFIYKGLVITSIQFIIFTIMATIGYFSWKNNAVNPTTTD